MMGDDRNGPKNLQEYADEHGTPFLCGAIEVRRPYGMRFISGDTVSFLLLLLCATDMAG